jgi:hypothetical protein
MEISIETLSYIEGKKFGGVIPLKIKQKETIQDRMNFVENIVRDKSIIHVGCLDHLPMIEEKIRCNRWFHGRLTQVASECLGVDINREGIDFLRSNMNVSNIIYCNLESNDKIAAIADIQWDYIIFGEMLEHVDNPVSFLQKFLSNYSKNIDNIILTVPNAFRAGNIKCLLQNIEAINTDHRYWFSPYTIWKVVHQAGLKVEKMQMCKYTATNGISGTVKDFFLQNFPLMAENIVVICHKNNS